MTNVLVIPGWFPSKLYPFNGDFILYQTQLMHQDPDLNLSLAFLDQSLKYLYYFNTWRTQWIAHPEIPFPVAHLQRIALPKSLHYLFPGLVNAPINKMCAKIPAIKKVDIIHAHCLWGGYIAQHIASRIKVPLVYTEHHSGILDHQLSQTELSTYQKLIDHSTEISAVGPALAAILQPFTPHRPVHIIPNFVDETLFTIHKTPKRTGFHFICIGDLIPIKQIDRLINAFDIIRNQYQDLHLHIIGDGPLKNDLTNQMKALNLTEMITFHGRQPNTEIPRLLNESHVLISASKHETFGITVLEALCCGLPVIVTPSGGPEQLVNSENGILLPSDSVESIAEGMTAIHRQYSNFKATEIRAHVLIQYSKGATIEAYKSLYSKCLKS
ncbi:MAG: glycosyltransferase [Saprospiraceae bacterium]|nr:glycosyltransferase [Saprospiraceae bacterium]